MRKVLALAALGALGVAVVPSLLPTGPDAGLDATGLLQSGRFAVAAMVIFLGGLLTALTPCVYPLIPITLGVFGAKSAESRTKAVMLVFSYVLGMGVVFSVLGVVAALSGKAFGSALGSPWVAGGLAVFLLVLATSMFGAFELALPSGLVQRLSNVGGGGVLGAALMGSVAGFLAAPCTGPVLAGVLAFVAQSQNAPIGGGLLFIYALGIGVPFFLLGVFAVRLPKGGVWMEWVKSIMGIALVALALSYVRDALPALRGLVSDTGEQLGRTPGALLAAVLTAIGVLLGAVHRSFESGGRELWLKLSGVSLVSLALLLRAGASNAPPVGALAVRLGLGGEVAAHGLEWDYEFPPRSAFVVSLDAFDAVLEKARREGRPVMIDFFAEWCEACKELDREVYVEADVVDEAKRFVAIKVDATNPDEAIDELFSRYRIQGLPTVVFIDGQGQVLDYPRITGFLAPQRFLAELKKVPGDPPCQHDGDCPSRSKCQVVACNGTQCPKRCT